MLYEPRLQTAENYDELKKSLRARGFTDVPAGVCPLLHFKAYAVAPIADTSGFKIHKTMMRKKK